MALTIAAVLVAPHSNFHGMVLLLAPLAFVVGSTSAQFPLRRVWVGLVLLGYLLSLAIWPFKVNSWLMVPVLLSGIAVLIVVCRTEAYESHRDGVPHPLSAGES